jgi:hypothetical protein
LANPEKKILAKEAAASLLPKSYPQVLDMEAAQAFGKPGKFDGWFHPRRLVTIGAGAVGGGAGYATGDPLLGLSLMGAMAGATSPKIHQALLGAGSRAFEKGLINRSLIQTGGRVIPWSLMREEQK